VLNTRFYTVHGGLLARRATPLKSSDMLALYKWEYYYYYYYYGLRAWQ